MENKTVYPEWVQNYRTKGTTVKKIGNSFNHCDALEKIEIPSSIERV